jgi:hypothetical protein
MSANKERRKSARVSRKSRLSGTTTTTDELEQRCGKKPFFFFFFKILKPFKLQRACDDSCGARARQFD